MITEENFLDFRCPYCSEPASFPEETKGLVRECPSCMESFIVPKDGSEVAGELPLPVTSPRLILRRFAPGDWKELMECMPDAEEENLLRWLETERTVRLTTPGETFYLGIELKDGGKLIGQLGFRFTDAERLQVALEICLNEKYEGTDLPVEAVDALLGFCFTGI